jgi:AmmeMemoRadiSam system protein A
MSLLTKEERRAVLEIARRALTEAIQRSRPFVPSAPSGALSELRGVFITLRRHGRLRGCIGQPEAVEPLAQAAARCAIAAALDDPRFAPVSSQELPGIEIEISVLSLLLPMAAQDIEAGHHGVLIAHLGRRGLLLPQVVAEYGWSRERFLEETCVKGGMERDAWKDPAAQILGFTAEIFSEYELRSEPEARAG